MGAEIFPANIYLLKINSRNFKKVWNMFKINNENFFEVLLTLNMFHPFF